MSEHKSASRGRRFDVKQEEVKSPSESALKSTGTLFSDSTLPEATSSTPSKLDENETHSIQSERVIEDVLKPKAKKLTLTKVFFVSFSVLILAELGMSIAENIQSNPLIAGLYLFVGAVSICLIGKFIWREYSALKALSFQQSYKDDAARLLNSDQIGEAMTWLKPLLARHPKKQVEEFKALLQSHNTDKEVVDLYSKTLLVDQDKQVKTLISDYATTSALLVALSPMALLDMLAVLWRGIDLIEKITQCYGIHLGYRSRVKLYVQLLRQLVFVGAAEVLTDLTTTSLSADLLGKLSARSAQGLSAGIFTARLGYKAMELCRPLPHLDKKQSLLSNTVKSISQTLLNKVKKVD